MTTFILGFVLGGVLTGILFGIVGLAFLKSTQRLQKLNFNELAQQLVEKKVDTWSEQNEKSLGLILNPLKERLKDFEKKVQDVYTSEHVERLTLKNEISKLVDLNVQMSRETENLTKALKVDVKSQGVWGELILENILQSSGLRKDFEYTTQGAFKNDKGEVIRPDVVIYLPEGKNLIVDSKVSLMAYEKYISATLPLEQEKWGREHLESLKRHIDLLSNKKYESSEELNSPDFVFLFMPIEPAFALAFRLKPELLQYAWDLKVALVSPTTLLTTLRTVAQLWKQDRQQKNTAEIVKRGTALYEKFVSFTEDLVDVGDKIDLAKKTHDQALSKLSQGTGNLVRQVEILKDLGLKSEKKIAKRLVQESSDNENAPPESAHS